MPAAATDLPPELIQRVIDFINGAWPTTFEWGNLYLFGANTTVELNKHEIGNVSLVCSYWARIIRRRLFRDLVLLDSDDATKFVSFVRFPHAEGFSIVPFVETLTLKQKLNDPPWIHRIIQLRNVLPRCHTFHLEIHGDAALEKTGSLSTRRPPRSVLPQLPRVLPPSVLSFPSLSSLEVYDTTFRHSGDLNVLIKSVRALDEPTSLSRWKFRRCALLVSDMAPPVRPIYLRLPSASLRFVNCTAPWTFISALFPTRGPARRFESAPEVWSPPSIPIDSLEATQKLVEAAMFSCRVHRVGNEDNPGTTHCCILNVTRDDPHRGWLSITLVNWCPAEETIPDCRDNGLFSMGVALSPSGQINSVTAVISNLKLTTSMPWTEIDGILAELSPKISVFTVRRDVAQSFRNDGKGLPLAAVIGTVESKMPWLQEKGKLLFLDYDRENGRHFRVTTQDAPSQKTEDVPSGEEHE